MNTKVVAGFPSWSTSSYGDAADTSPGELSALGEHLGACNGSSGRFFSLQCAGEMMRGFVSARFVTSVAAVALVIGIGCIAWL